MNNEIRFHEYADPVPGVIRNNVTPTCKNPAVIPLVTVESTAQVLKLADCFVHVNDTNTTYYIDDKHRMAIIWAGPVQINDYDYATNPKGLKNQICFDTTNKRAIYFTKTGAYYFMPLSATP